MDEVMKCYEMMSADGSKGIVHSFMLVERIPVPLRPMPWFHGSITRFEAEKLLDRNKDGQFLLRTSQHSNGIFALAMVSGGVVKHYLVAMNFKKRRLTIDGKVFSDDLCELVEYYKNHSSPALEVKLTEPVVRHSYLEFFVDTNILEQKWGLSKREVVVHQVIGKGEFGEVYAGECRGLQVAVKTLLSQKQNAHSIANFTREAAIMSYLCHPNVVQLIGVHYHGSTLQSIVMELLGKGALSKYLMTRGRAVISQKELFSFARDVCDGMSYLSSRGFVHRDVAARNVLLNGNGQAKISDLGLARKADIYVPNEGGKFPTKWTAPEALKSSRFSTMSDVWSYGILLWEIYSFGRVPFPSIPSDDILEQLEDGYRMDPPEGCHYHIYSIMEQCWELEPTERPSFTKLQELLDEEATGAPRLPSPIQSAQQSSAKGFANLWSLATSPAAVSAYQEAPKSHKVAIILASILMLGPEGSGKTSFVRSLKGEPFRLHEPGSVAVTLEERFSKMKDHLDWLMADGVLSFEEQLVGVIVEDIMKSLPGHFSLPSSAVRSQSTEDLLSPDEVFEGVEFRRRSSSTVTKPAELKPKGKRKFLSSFRKSHLKKVEKGGKQSESSSCAARRGPPKITILSDDGTAVVNGHPLLSDPSSPPSSIPDSIITKVIEGLEHCSHDSRPTIIHARIIDCPGRRPHCLLRPLLVSPTSLSLLVFDVSLDPYHVYAQSESPSAQGSPSCTTGHTIYLDHILNELADICLHQPQHELQRGSRIVLIGTHCDQISMSVANHRLSIVVKAIQESPFKQYVAPAKFLASSSSILDRSNSDEIKRYLMELTRKFCKQQVPLRWLRIVPKIKQLEKLGRYFITLEQLRALAAAKCISEEEDDFDQLLSFLTSNHVILHFDLVHLLRDLVITSPSWFLKKAGSLLSLSPSHSTEVRQHVPDPKLGQVVSTGLLSEQLLDRVWDDVTDKAELLLIMQKMEFVCCLPIRQQSAGDSGDPEGAISKIYVPALVDREPPFYFNSEFSTTDLKPLYFRFKDGFAPLGLYYRLVARCIHSYPDDVKLFQNSACFVVDNDHTLVLCIKDHLISIIVQDATEMKRLSTASEDDFVAPRESYPSLAVASNDVCLAVLMFVQAAITDIIHQWIPQVDFDLCVPCICNSSRSVAKASHYVVLNDSEEWMETGILVCEIGSQFLPLPGITRWFGAANNDQTSVDDDIELVTVDDVVTIANALGHSWRELGHLLGFSDDELKKFSSRHSNVSLPALIIVQEGKPQSSQTAAHLNEQSPAERMLREWLSVRGINARLFSLLSALEIIQRRDVADSLIAARMIGPGVMI